MSFSFVQNVRNSRIMMYRYNNIAKHLCRIQPKHTDSRERVAITDDGSTVVCWHPEKPFPYECSKPITEANIELNSVLKVQNLSEVYEVFKPKSEQQTREELMKITGTSKHRWFPQGKKTYKKKPEPKDREYL